MSEFSALIMMIYWILGFSSFHFVAGEKPSCTADKPMDLEFVSGDQDVGFLRDMCVEVGRNLHKCLRPSVPTTACDKVAKIRTSVCIYRIVCWKLKRSHPWNSRANTNLMAKAVEMMKYFNDEAAKHAKIPDINDQQRIVECIDTTSASLISAGAAKENSELINYMAQIKQTFCSDYLRRLEEQKTNDRTSEAEALRLTAEENGSQHQGIPENSENLIPVTLADDTSGSGVNMRRQGSGLSRDDSFAAEYLRDEELAKQAQLEEDIARDARIASELAERLQTEDMNDSAARQIANADTEARDRRVAQQMERQSRDEAAQADARRRAAAETAAEDSRIAQELARHDAEEANAQQRATEAATVNDGQTAQHVAQNDLAQAEARRRESEGRQNRDTPAARAAIERAERAAAQRATQEAAQRPAAQGPASQVPASQGPTTQTTLTPSPSVPQRSYDVSQWTDADPDDFDFDDFIRKDFPVIAFFYSQFNRDNQEIKDMRLNVAQLIHEKNGKVRLVTEAIEAATMTCGQYEIVSAPSTLIFLKGYAKHNIKGLVSVETLRSKLEEVMREAGQTP